MEQSSKESTVPHAYVEQQSSDDCQENACGQRERSYSGTAIEHGSAYEFHPRRRRREVWNVQRNIEWPLCISREHAFHAKPRAIANVPRGDF